MDKDLVNNLERQLTDLGSSVGFMFEGGVQTVEGETAPEGSMVWSSPFAVMVLVPVSRGDLKSAARDAQDWLWRRITVEEKRAKFLDGYLLLALSSLPDGSLRTEVGQIELDTSVCRKHVVWPNDEGNWNQKLWAVTCLGLPEIQDSSAVGLTMPSLPPAASRSLIYYESIKNYEAVADKLIEEAKLAAAKTT